MKMTNVVSSSSKIKKAGKTAKMKNIIKRFFCFFHLEDAWWVLLELPTALWNIWFLIGNGLGKAYLWEWVSTEDTSLVKLLVNHTKSGGLRTPYPAPLSEPYPTELTLNFKITFDFIVYWIALCKLFWAPSS